MEFEYEEIPESNRLSIYWKGYLKSSSKNGVRFWAKCRYCEKEFEGRVEYLKKHKLQDCPKKNSWPAPDIDKIRDNEAEARRSIAVGAGLQLISKFAKPMEPFNQDVANEKFLKALISTSVPFSFASNPHVREYFEYLGIRVPDRIKLRNDILPQLWSNVKQVCFCNLISPNTFYNDGNDLILIIFISSTGTTGVNCGGG